jgi:hypothetical protein
MDRDSWKFRTITLVVAVCRRCGKEAVADYTEEAAIKWAEEEGWSDGLCFECWERDLLRRGEMWGIP